MNAFLRILFKRMPKVGDIYVLDSEDPFKEPYKVRVLETRKEWVRYASLDNYFRDTARTMNRSDFHYCYKRDTGND